MMQRWNACSQLMAEKKASDIYLSADSPILIKINGHVHADQPDQLLTPDAAAPAAAPRC